MSMTLASTAVFTTASIRKPARSKASVSAGMSCSTRCVRRALKKDLRNDDGSRGLLPSHVLALASIHEADDRTACIAPKDPSGSRLTWYEEDVQHLGQVGHRLASGS